MRVTIQVLWMALQKQGVQIAYIQAKASQEYDSLINLVLNSIFEPFEMAEVEALLAQEVRSEKYRQGAIFQ